MHGTRFTLLLWSILPMLLVVLAYVWIVSLGTWTTWPTPYNYSHFDKLASAFMHGRLSLEETPTPGLLALADPYDPTVREDLPYLIDASLFAGRYYLYFGPVPALLLIPAKILVHAVIPDVYLLFTFACAVFLAEAVLILQIRRLFFPAIPSWLLAPSLLFAGLSTPLPWILGSQATPHNAAIAAGQFFFLAGLSSALAALAGPRLLRGWALAAGIFWAAAIGSRITQLLPVGFVTVLAVIYLARSASGAVHRRTLLMDAAAFVLPLLLGLGALGWYNWVRFGSYLETGFSFQLAMLPIQQYSHDLFSPQYAIQNLYNYMLNPPKWRFAFPYLWPQVGVRAPVLPGMDFPRIYFTEENTGLALVTPFLVYAFCSAARFHFPTRPSLISANESALTWLKAALLGSFVCGLVIFLAFFWASNRYLLDFSPPLVLLAILGFFQVTETLRLRPVGRGVVIAIGLGLILVSLAAALLITLAQNADAYSALDPHMGKWLRRLFAP